MARNRPRERMSELFVAESELFARTIDGTGGRQSESEWHSARAIWGEATF